MAMEVRVVIDLHEKLDCCSLVTLSSLLSKIIDDFGFLILFFFYLFDFKAAGS